WVTQRVFASLTWQSSKMRNQRCDEEDSFRKNLVSCVAGGGNVILEFEAEAKAHLKVRLCTGTEGPNSGIHYFVSVKDYCISEVHSKDHSFCDAALDNRADIQDRVV